ncbi:MAG: class I SAM-dependent methyltransferase [bacterium]
MHKFNPANADNLNNPQRLAHEQPDKILRAAGVSKGMTVVDVGCGTGFYTFPLSEIVGEKGLVYAVDMSADMLNLLKKELSKHNLKNIKPILSEEVKIPLNDGIADMVINVNMLHEAYDKDAFIQELRRLLKKNGRLLIIDHKKDPDLSGGPPFEDRVSYEEALGLLKKYFDIVVKGPSGDRQYGIVAMKG